jgi:hypothetical protein
MDSSNIMESRFRVFGAATPFDLIGVAVVAALSIFSAAAA